MIKLTTKEQEARKRICLALDVSDVREALILVDELSDYVGMFKIGKQLHISAGNQSINIVQAISDKGGEVFLDLKLHDTPNTVFQASKECSVSGVCIFNVHIAGGEEMCRQAVEGAKQGAFLNNIKTPKVIGVTVLTSLNDEDLKAQHLGIKYDDLVTRRTELAKKWGLNGIVCPASKAGELEKKFGSDFLYVTPGIQWDGKMGKAQKQLYTPDLAVKDCKNSILVIGSAITNSQNKKAIAYEILQAMAKEL